MQRGRPEGFDLNRQKGEPAKGRATIWDLKSEI